MFLLYFEPGTSSEGAMTELSINTTESVLFALPVRASIGGHLWSERVLSIDQGRTTCLTKPKLAQLLNNNITSRFDESFPQ